MEEYIQSEFKYRVIREDEFDIDYFLDLEFRTLDISNDFFEKSISRLQFPKARGLVVRTTRQNREITIHVLRDIDLMSAFANFEIDLKDKKLLIKKEEEKAVMSFIFL